MAKQLVFPGAKIRFPNCCVICMEAADKEYGVSRTFNYGNQNITISFKVPMCTTHYNVATQKNAKERLVGKIGVWSGAALGAVGFIALLAYWSSTGQGNLFLNIFLALVLGLGIFLILWALISLVIAPNFGDHESKSARRAVSLKKYYPGPKELVVEFTNDRLADLVQQGNPGCALAK